MTVRREKSEATKSLTQAQAMLRSFRKNRVAVASALLLSLFYVVILFADFLSPYNMTLKRTDMRFTPPQRIHIVDAQGRWHAPFVYGLETFTDEVTLRRTYRASTSTRYQLRLFVRGDEYKLLGLFRTNVHFFGVEEGGTVFLLGTDSVGRDLFSRILMGGRVSLSVGLVGVLLSTLLGSILGVTSGYYGGVTDHIIQRIIELLQSFPTLPLWMALSAALPPHWSSIAVYFGIVTILSLIGWTGLARTIRGMTLRFAESELVMASKCLGGSDWRIITRHLIPNVTSHIIVVATISVPATIIGESALSFLGLGIKAPMTSWGVLLREAQSIAAISMYPWLITPAFFIIFVVLAFNFVGDGIRDAADPFSSRR